MRHWLVAAMVAVAASCSSFGSDDDGVQAPERGDAAAGVPCVLDDPKAPIDQCTIIE